MTALSHHVGPSVTNKNVITLSGRKNLHPTAHSHTRPLPSGSKYGLQNVRFSPSHALFSASPSSSWKLLGSGRCRNRRFRFRLGNRRLRANAFNDRKETEGETEAQEVVKESDGDLYFRQWSSQEDRKDGSRPLSKAEKEGMSAGFLRWLRRSGGKALEPAVGEKGHLAKIESQVFQFTRQLGKYTFAMTGTGTILATGFQLIDGGPRQQAVLWFSWAAGIVLGSMIGADHVLKSHKQRGPRNVVITGSTRGLGKALAREFLRAGDNVVVTSRSEEAVAITVAELQTERAMQMPSNLSGPLGLTFLNDESEASTLNRVARLSDAGLQRSNLPKQERRLQKVIGIACSVQSSEDVKRLAATAVRELGSVDIWINNAGSNAGAKPLIECTDSELEAVVSTNLMGSLVCTREAILLMKQQPRGGHIFNMDGAGSGGSATPKYAAYGATKCGLRQLGASLQEECKKGRIGIHTASPGMVLTDLLLSGATLQNKQVFNIVCEQPETVAQALVPRLRAVRGKGQAINYLTPPRIVLALVTAWLRRGRWFDEEGRAVYAAEADRLRMWAEGEGKRHSPLAAAMDLAPSSAWLSLFSSSVICAYIMLSNIAEAGPPGGGGL